MKKCSGIILSFMLTAIVSGCGNTQVSSSLQPEVTPVAIQSEVKDVQEINIDEMTKILNGTKAYLASRIVWGSVEQMPPEMQFYFKRIDNKYKITGNILMEKSGLLFKDYTLRVESDNKQKCFLTTREFLTKTKAENWLKTIPVNKKATAYFSVRKVNWREIGADPFVIEKFEDVK